MRRFGDVIRLPVVAADTAERVGVVTGLVTAASPARVEFVRMRSSRGDESVPWAQIRAIGPDAVMIFRASGPYAEAGADDRASDPVGKQLLTDRGQWLGDVQECAFDEADGRLISFSTTTDVFAGDRLLGVGDFAVVIRSEASREKADGEAAST
ncbi:hypothetical protein GCM10010215_26110 [Streptomyces virginiae]|uniref:PRC-barrel domain-containing protein n=1 Tax=Streptomyces virginiae TaxID=1961 RepID=A0ABQ3NN60_STRVG|nr:hypothetical protein [Streptomyces virginiae]MBP2341914.1 uncharacterized protein YrrD [Streptomyces virginiae]GGP99148.1 hypothetical protein GCM10010215_26110 [Streptomyces virginiae]GHI14210.1 hypothetical protein Scinn_36730 [Streptomyces virginiae]